MNNKTNSGLVYELEEVACPLCGASSAKPYLEAVPEWYCGTEIPFDICRCSACSMVYTNPRVTEATIGCFYQDSSQYYQPGKVKYLENPLLLSLLASHMGYAHLPRRFGAGNALWPVFKNKIFLKHVPYYAQNGRLLDIGASWGEYMAQMRALGWNVYGIEMNEAAVRAGKELLNLEGLECADFNRLAELDGGFDAINMSMVLEHSHNPSDLLAMVRKLLVDNGQLILSVPNIDGLAARMFGKYFYSLHVPQHTLHFSPLTIRACLEKAGFGVERVLYRHEPSDFLNSLKLGGSRFYGLCNAKPVKNIVVRNAVKLCAALKKTSRMTVCCRKK